MHNLPTVSIVTPSFNHAKYIDATIRSVLDQNYPRLQYIVMDGGSTDDTAEILRRYDEHIAARNVRHPNDSACPGDTDLTFIWNSERDRGQADAINKGFARATGEIIGWLNSDDCYKPGALMAAAQYLRDHPDIALVYGDAEFITADGSYLCPCANTEPFSRHRLRHYSDYIVQPAAFFRRSSFESVGGLDASLNFAMDYDLWLKLADRYKLAYVPQVWAQYRWLGENKSAAGGWSRIEEVRQVARRHGIRRLPAYFRLEAVNLHLQSAKSAWGEGKTISAMRSLLRAAANAVSSPRAIWSLCQARTRRIIKTGRILRSVD